MNRVPYINDARRDEILRDAADRQTPVVLTRRGPGGWRTAKSRFLGQGADSHQLLIEHPPGVDHRSWPVPRAGELLGVAFRRGHKKCVFSTVVVGREGPDLADGEEPPIAVQWPGDVQELQRRVYQRACPPADRKVEVTIAPASDPSESPAAFTAVMEDLSAGGVRVRHQECPAFALGQAVRVRLTLGSRGSEVEADGTFRHQEATSDGQWSLGFQFVGLETSREGQELLARIARIVTDFQRAAIRRRPPRLRSPRRTR